MDGDGSYSNLGSTLGPPDELDLYGGSSLSSHDGEDSPDLIFLAFQAAKEYPAILASGTIFKPNENVNVRITNVTRLASSRFHPHVYDIDLNHAGYHWTIRRRYQKIHKLHRRLRLFAMSLRLSRKAHIEHLTSNLKPKLPEFPRHYEFFLNPEELESKRLQLEKYLQELLAVPLWREHPETLKFLEVSTLSFLGELGEKGKEMALKKLTGRIRIPLLCSTSHMFCDTLSRWKERWILVKDTYYAYMSSRSNRIANVLLIDKDTRVERDPRYSLRHKSVVVSNSSRDLVLKFRDQRDLDDWIKYFEYVLITSAAQFVKPHPHGSSFPVRDEGYCKWFIDGSTYMSAVADALEAAEEEIFITDWWLTPEIYLKRPITEGEKWRLDRVLQRRAEAGVKVYVLLYKEVPIALGINSFYSKSVLASRHPNIKVQRHPDHLGGNVWFWSHHEKTVVIDQKIAFLGGIDLCYGRWDDHLYRLTDTGPIDADSMVAANEAPVFALEGVSPASNNGTLQRTASADVEQNGLPRKPPRTSLFNVAQQLKQQHLNKVEDFPAAAIRSATTKSPATELVRSTLPQPAPNPSVHMNTRKSKVEIKRFLSVPGGNKPRSRRNTVEIEEVVPAAVNLGDNSMHLSTGLASKQDSPKLRRTARVIQNAIRMGRSLSHRDAEDVVDGPKPADIEADLDRLNIKVAGRLWLGKDYCNEIRQSFTAEAMEAPELDDIDRMTVPRMPWHDIGCVVFEKAARDVARHFIQRWNACKVEKNKRDTQYTFLVPKSYDTTEVNRTLLSGAHRCRLQILRSVSSWSAGLRPGQVEDSIHQAYIRCIQLAEHFIFIENQFFITLASDKKIGVNNGIGEALFQRVRKAHELNEKFRVYVIMPLKPGIEGEYGTNRGAAVQAVTHWNYQSICRGGNSLFERVAELGADPTRYFSFCGMRTFGELNGKLISELIYVHSKMMIVDDRYTIIGSANINDRSMLGSRDSEMAVLVKDLEFEDGLVDGKPTLSGKFSGRLRKRLMKIHLGIWNDPGAEKKVMDAVCDDFFDEWNQTAVRNEEIYEEVFACLPCDKVSNFIQLNDWLSANPKCVTDPEESKERLKGVKGYLTKLSLDFLKDQDLTPSFSTRESILPVAFWT